MPEEFTIYDNFFKIGTCEGFYGSDNQGNYILFHPDMCGIVQTGNTLVTSQGERLELKIEEQIGDENGLKCIKIYFSPSQ